jgi:hypothetical protein
MVVQWLTWSSDGLSQRETGVQSLDILCGICGGQNVAGTGYSLSPSALACQDHCTNTTNSFILL